MSGVPPRIKRFRSLDRLGRQGEAFPEVPGEHDYVVVLLVGRSGVADAPPPPTNEQPVTASAIATSPGNRRYSFMLQLHKVK